MRVKRMRSRRINMQALKLKDRLTYGRRQWQLLPGKSRGWSSLIGYSPWVTKSQTWLSDFTFTFHFHALEKEMATHSSVLVWRTPGTGKPGDLLSMESHRVGHDGSDLAAATTAHICLKCWEKKISERLSNMEGKRTRQRCSSCEKKTFSCVFQKLFNIPWVSECYVSVYIDI